MFRKKKMRECNQINCEFLKLKQGCRKCFFCSAQPFIVADDCPTCYDCENIPNSLRWDDDNNSNQVEEKECNQIEEKELQIVKMK